MKNKILLSLVGSLLILILSLGVSYSYYNSKIKPESKTKTVFKETVLGLVYTGIDEINITNDMMQSNSFEATFTVQNTSNKNATFNIYMEDINNQFMDNDLVYSLYETDSSGYELDEIINKKPLPKSIGLSYLKTNIKIDSYPAKKYYKFKISYEPLNKNQNKKLSFNARVMIDTKSIKDKYEVGNILTFDSEKFYIFSNDGINIKALSMYNVDTNTNKQSDTLEDISVVFSYNNNAYDNSFIKKLVDNYIQYLNSTNNINAIGSLITYEELLSLGCAKEVENDNEIISCNLSEDREKIKGIYWTSSMNDDGEVYVVDDLKINSYKSNEQFRKINLRPVVTIAISEIE